MPKPRKPKFKPTKEVRLEAKALLKLSKRILAGKLRLTDYDACNLVSPIVSDYGRTTKLITTGHTITLTLRG